MNREQLSAYQDGELSPQEVAPVEAHLSDCAECRALLVEMKAVGEALGALPTIEPSRGFAAGVMQTTRARRRRRKVVVQRLVGYAVAASIVLVVGLWMAGNGNGIVPITLADLPNLDELGDETYLGVETLTPSISGDLSLDAIEWTNGDET